MIFVPDGVDFWGVLHRLLWLPRCAASTSLPCGVGHTDSLACGVWCILASEVCYINDFFGLWGALHRFLYLWGLLHRFLGL